MSICDEVAKRSTCQRIQTAALLVENNNVVSMGYNGSAPKAVHCTDYWKNYCEMRGLDYVDFLASDEFYARHHEYAVANEHHAEMNCLANASRRGFAKSATMYTTYACCIHCAKQVVACGVGIVVYRHEYSRDTSGLDYLRSHGVVCKKFGDSHRSAAQPSAKKRRIIRSLKHHK